MIIEGKYKKIKPFISRDGPLIMELFHPEICGKERQSVTEAIITNNLKTFPHNHDKGQEIYQITLGTVNVRWARHNEINIFEIGFVPFIKLSGRPRYAAAAAYSRATNHII